jgi:hypothetical protein
MGFIEPSPSPWDFRNSTKTESIARTVDPVAPPRTPPPDVRLGSIKRDAALSKFIRDRINKDLAASSSPRRCRERSAYPRAAEAIFRTVVAELLLLDLVPPTGTSSSSAPMTCLLLAATCLYF